MDVTIVDGNLEEHETLFDAVVALLDAIESGKVCEVYSMDIDGSLHQVCFETWAAGIEMFSEDRTYWSPETIANATTMFLN